MKNLVAALIKAQGEFRAVKREDTAAIETKSGSKFSYKYADLETCIEATAQALRNNGLAVIQTFAIEGGKNALKTTLIHESGESMSGTQIIDCKDNLDPQKIGSASTYSRRYSYMAILGIAPEDDDANHAAQPVPVAKPAYKLESKTQSSEQKPKEDLFAEVLGVKWNEEKKRSEYEVQTDEDTHFVIFIKNKKPITITEREKVKFINYWDFKPEKGDRVYPMAENIVKVNEIEEEIMF